MASNDELLSLREKNRVLTEENKELRKELQLLVAFIAAKISELDTLFVYLNSA